MIEFTRPSMPGQGMTVDIGAFWQKFAKDCIAAATKPAEAQGKTVADLVAEGEDAFFAAVAAGDAKHFGKISELNKKSIFAEAVQILQVPGYRIMYDPMGDYHARAIPEAELVLPSSHPRLAPSLGGFFFPSSSSCPPPSILPSLRCSRAIACVPQSAAEEGTPRPCPRWILL